MSKLVTWEESLTVGVDIIDEQHRILIDLANDLYVANKTGGSDSVVETLFQVITNFSLNHFETEEELFKEDASYLVHCHEHYQLIKRLHRYQVDFHNNRHGEIDPGTFFRKWLLDHIAGTDVPTFKRQSIDLSGLKLADANDEPTDVDDSEHRTEKRVRTEQFGEDDIVCHCFNATKSLGSKAVITDISPGGLKLSTTANHEIADLLLVNARIGKNFKLEEKVRVRNIDPSGHYGTEFISPNPKTCKFIKELQGAVGRGIN